MRNNPMVILEQDADDREMITEAMKDLGYTNELVFLENSGELIEYLETTPAAPFFILCDVNLRPEDGFRIREKIEQNKQVYYKSVPFIYLSTEASDGQIKKAYDLHSQGFFLKANSYGQLKEILQALVTYWSLSEHPKQL